MWFFSILSSEQQQGNPNRSSLRTRYVPQLEDLEARDVPAVISWDGGANTMSWHDPANWSGDVLPGGDDDVIVGALDPGITIHSNDDVTINTLTSEVGLDITAGTFALATDSFFNNTLSLSNGKLAASQTVTVLGELTWLGGEVEVEQLDAKGGITLDVLPEGSTKTLDGLLVNHGTAVWSAGTIGSQGNRGSIHNRLGATFTMTDDLTFSTDPAPPVDSFVNHGTFEKTGGTGVSGATFNGTFVNHGEVILAVGALNLNVGAVSSNNASTGSFVGAEGTTLQLSGGDSLNTSSLTSTSSVSSEGNVSLLVGSWLEGNPRSLTLAGAYEVTESTTVGQHGRAANRDLVRLTGDVRQMGKVTVTDHGLEIQPNNGIADLTLDSLTLNNVGGKLSSTKDLVIEGQFTWSGGELEVHQTIAKGGLTLNGDNKSIDGVLVNQSTAVWSDGDITSQGNRGSIHNKPGAVLTLEADLNLGGDPELAFDSFINEGLFEKTGGSSTSGAIINGSFINHGQVDLQVGEIAYSHFFQQAAGSLLLSGGSVTAADEPIEIEGGEVIGSGVMRGEVVNGGQFRPGNLSSPVGTIIIDGIYTQSETGILDIDLSGPAAGSEHDQLVVGGTVKLEGDLNIELRDDYAPPINTIFTIIDNTGGSSVEGTFDELLEGDTLIVESRAFEISYLTENDVTLKIVNSPPIADVGGPYTAVRGSSIELDGSGSTDPEQTTQSLTYQWDLDGDGIFGETGSNALRGDESGIRPTFSAIGLGDPQAIPITLRVIDSFNATDEQSTTINVVTHALLPDPLSSGQTMLVVGGTLGDDHIIFTPGSNTGEIEVKLNGSSMGMYTPTSRVVAFAQAGNDTIQISGSLPIAAWLYGQEGDDKLRGGSGNDVLIGGTGEDLLVGKNGRDLLIGGTGADRIVGNADDDLLIAGSITFDSNEAAIAAIMAEWSSERDLDTRVSNLQDGSGSSDRANGNVFLQPGVSVIDDGEEDILTGSAGQDYYLLAASDRITDLDDEELADVLAFILEE